MPIVVIPEPGASLAQGDILKDVVVGVTAEDGRLVADATCKFVLVVSRHCNAVRDSTITVAPVVQQRARPSSEAPKEPTLDSMRRTLMANAEGGVVYDNFYLGPLDESNARYTARLATLVSIRVPADTAVRQQWIAARRVGRLHIDFIHDLHFRLFAAYARLGFDDHAWFPDADLAMLISAGQREVAELQSAIASAELAYQEQESEGRVPAKQQQEQIAKKKHSLAELQDKLAPYIAEHQHRLSSKKE